MRTVSVSCIKGIYTFDKLQQKPRQGSRLRAIYDVFVENKGKPIEMPAGLDKGNMAQLTDYYGLDIRHIQRGFHRNGINRPSLYVLAGEWFGKTYIDYIAEVMEQK